MKFGMYNEIDYVQSATINAARPRIDQRNRFIIKSKEGANVDEPTETREMLLEELFEENP